MRDPSVADLLILLRAETTAIITGEYTVLDDLAPRKLALFDQLPQMRITATDLQLVSVILLQNQTLLGAAIKGIGAARDRLSALRKVRDGLQVYDQSGRFVQPPLNRPDLVKKA